MAEQWFCKPQVPGSSPGLGSVVSVRDEGAEMSWRRLSRWYQHAIDDLDSWFEKREWLAILIALALFLALAVHDAILGITYYGMPIVPP